MDRSELKEIIRRVIERVQQEELQSPQPGCTFNDNCDVTTKYGVSEES